MPSVFMELTQLALQSFPRWVIHWFTRGALHPFDSDHRSNTPAWMCPHLKVDADGEVIFTSPFFCVAVNRSSEPFVAIRQLDQTKN